MEKAAENGGARQVEVAPSAALLQACAPLLRSCDAAFTSFYERLHGAGSVTSQRAAPLCLPAFAASRAQTAVRARARALTHSLARARAHTPSAPFALASPRAPLLRCASSRACRAS
jgi:hypothetical protein